MNMKERIERFNHENRPFYIVDHDGGQFSLCLPLDFLDDEFENYGQAAFDAYALEIGEPPINCQGFQTHGNGYEWEAAFCQAFADDPNIDKILFDCESGGFFCYTADLSLLEDFGKRFKAICEDSEKFTPIVSNGIKNAEVRREEQERLMRTVRGKLMSNPGASFNIITPDGSIHLTADDARQLLDGDVEVVRVGSVYLCPDELLDQEVVRQQTDIFDEDLIRMKTQEVQQELGFDMRM